MDYAHIFENDPSLRRASAAHLAPWRWSDRIPCSPPCQTQCRTACAAPRGSLILKVSLSEQRWKKTRSALIPHNDSPVQSSREESKRIGWKRWQRWNWLCQDAISSVYTLWCVPGHPRCQFSWFCPFILQIRTLEFRRIHVCQERETHIRLCISVWPSLEKKCSKVNVSQLQHE